MISGSSKSIIFLGALLLVLETVLFVKFSQHGLDDRLCKCAEPSESPPEARVLNGVSANGSDFKWLASIFHHKTKIYKSDYNEIITHICTASNLKHALSVQQTVVHPSSFFIRSSVLTASFLITAGHCFLVKGIDRRLEPYKDQMFVGAGTPHNLTRAYLSEANRRKIDRVHLYPGFEEIQEEYDERMKEELVVLFHDIALVELNKPFPLGDPGPDHLSILPGCLFERMQDDFDNDQFIVTGFGNRDPSSDRTPSKIFEIENRKIKIVKSGDDLQMIRMTQSDVCDREMKVTNKTFVLCLSDKRNRSYTHIGDSGGPVHLVQDGKSFIVGVISVGSADTNDPPLTMVAKVDRYVDWIDSFLDGQRCLPNGHVFKFVFWKFSVLSLSVTVTLIFMLFLLAVIG